MQFYKELLNGLVLIYFFFHFFILQRKVQVPQSSNSAFLCHFKRHGSDFPTKETFLSKALGALQVTVENTRIR